MYLGKNKKCSSGCSKSGNVEGKLSRVPTIVREAVNDKLQKVIRKTPSLLIEATTNIGETFMRIVVKFLGHKQVCRSKRNSHRVRVTAEALANSLGNKWHSHTYKSVFGRSPSKRISVRGELPKNDSEYGPNCETPDLLHTEFEAAKQLYLRKMKPSIDQLNKLPVIMAGQADNPKWISKRMETISNTRFHSICVRRPATSSARLVKEIVTGKQMYCNWQMNHGVD